MPHATATVVEEALRTSEATARRHSAPRLQTKYVVTGPKARYYRITTTDHDRTETIGYEYAVEIGIDEATLSDGDLLHPFTDLPAHDRTSLHSGIGNAGLLHVPHYSSFSVVFTYEHDAVQERSRFIPETDVQYVEWEDGTPIGLRGATTGPESGYECNGSHSCLRNEFAELSASDALSLDEDGPGLTPAIGHAVGGGGGTG